jgi:glycosyltransferase involved in cell wall biosynthesis
VPSGRRFYAIGKWEPRKNYHTLLGAFLRAFSPQEKASLMIKTHGWGQWKDYPDVRSSIAHWLEDSQVRGRGWDAETFQKRVRIVTKMLSDEEMNKLHEQNNIYVSPSHGEAWELGAFDALAAGNSLVHVGWGGSEDYAEDTASFLGSPRMNACVVPVHRGEPRLEPVPAEYGWEAGAHWAACDVAELAAALSEAVPPSRRVHPPVFYKAYGAHAVGSRMQQLVRKLANDLNPSLPGRLASAGGFG